MMNMIEEAIIYATLMHQGVVRKFGGNPYILHPLEVAQIISTMTDDEEIITAGILHDIVEDTDGTLEEINKRFGDRVAMLVNSESENKYPQEDESASWKKRKEESILVLKNSNDTGVQMLWLADKLSNIRSLAGIFSEKGDKVWDSLHQKDPDMHCWYYRSVAEATELKLNRTGAFKEFIKHINFIWPGTFDSVKTRYRKYKKVSLEGAHFLARGKKGDVYRYDDETVIKVFNDNNTYADVERELAHSRKAFVLGMPTVISFGIVDADGRYGAMYELMKSHTLSEMIAKSPGRVDVYAALMADLAHSIHSITVTDEDGFPGAYDRLREYIREGIDLCNSSLAEKCMDLINDLPQTNTLVHGDFHTGNVFLRDGEEPVLIDLDRLSSGHPIVEISDLYYFYVVLGENDPAVVEDFMGFSYDTSGEFMDAFLECYLDTQDKEKINDVKEKAAFICYIRAVHRICKNVSLSKEDEELIDVYTEKISKLADKLDGLTFN